MSTERPPGERRADARPDAPEELGSPPEVDLPAREPTRTRWYLPAVIGLLALGTPWYLPAVVAERRYWGLPTWVWISLLCAVGLATVTALASLYAWRDLD